MEINQVEFVKSGSNYKDSPNKNLPEYAFIGRSNVGKSSLINMLMQRKHLAKTSATPGKTQLLNYFLVNESWYLTDLPGFGYAKVSKKERQKFNKLITDYILKDTHLTNLFMLLDARHAPLKNDLEFIEFLGVNGIPFSIIFTKIDKLRGKKVHEVVQEYEDVLSEKWEETPLMFTSSATKGDGREEILDYIQQINTQIAEK